MAMVGIGGEYAQHQQDAIASIYVFVLFGALFHLMNHAIFKCALFMGVGILDHEAGSRDIRILSGMRQLFPKMNLVMTIAALSMAGVPFLNGFLSKEMFLDALTQTGQLSQFSLISMIAIVFVGVIASIFTFTYALYMVKEVFWTKYDSKVFTKKISTNHGCLVYPLLY